MPRDIIELTRRAPPLLRTETTIAEAVRELVEAGLPALPVTDAAGRLAGIFGQLEFIAALFPAYVGMLDSATFVPRSIDAVLERRASCATRPVGEVMLREHVEAREDYADVQLAEIFLHHGVRIVPVTADDGRVTGLVTRDDFFSALAERFLA